MGWYFLAGVVATGFAVFLYVRHRKARNTAGTSVPGSTSKRDAVRSDVTGGDRE